MVQLLKGLFDLRLVNARFTLYQIFSNRDARIYVVRAFFVERDNDFDKRQVLQDQ